MALCCKQPPDILPYASNTIRTWRDLIGAADTVRPYLGITPDGWAQARRVMGTEVAAVVVAAMLQRAVHIHRPGAYLRALCVRAAEGVFSPGPMVMALLRADEARAA